MIDSKDISVVVQGAFDKINTYKCIRSARKHFPKAEIIFSTWAGTDVTSVEKYCDKIIFNKDPGGVIFDEQRKVYNNLNRILVSSYAGIIQAANPYVLRIRSDLYLKNSKLLKLTDDLHSRNSNYSLFKNRIFAYECFSIKYDITDELRQNMLFHISDWCHFGLKEDIQELFNIPLVEEPDFSRYFEKNYKTKFDDIHLSRLWKMSPEQYITSMNAKKVIKDFNFDNYLDINPQNIEISENFIINNFRVYSQKQWGIYPLKKSYKKTNMRDDFLPYDYYSDYVIKQDYKNYIDPNYKIPKYHKFKAIIYSNRKLYFKLNKHYKKIFKLINDIIKSPITLISEIASVFYYSSKIVQDYIYLKINKKRGKNEIKCYNCSKFF